MIPKEFRIKCGGCGESLDGRDLGQVLSHGWIEGDKIVCYVEKEIPYSYSRKKGNPEVWTKDMNSIIIN
jgi:hypothetical protein